MALAAALARLIAHARLTVPSRVRDDQIGILACVGGFEGASIRIRRPRDLTLCSSLQFYDPPRSRVRESSPSFHHRDDRRFDATDPFVLMHSALIAKRNRDTREQIYIAALLWRSGSRFSPQGLPSSLEVSKSWRFNDPWFFAFPWETFSDLAVARYDAREVGNLR